MGHEKTRSNAPGREEDKRHQTEGRSEEQLEYARTHPDWLAGVPPAPPQVTAGQFENTRPEEAGHLPEDERGRS